MERKIKFKMSNFVVFIAVAIMAIMTAVIVKNKATKNVAQITNPEILRSISYEQVQDGDEKVEGCENVKFSAFFTKDVDGDGHAEKLLGSCQSVIQQSQLYIDVGVEGDGHVENGVISINGQNFKLSMSLIKDSLLKNNVVSNDVKEIELNNVVAGNSEVLIGTISPNITSPENYTKINQITFTGTYVPDEGDSKEISKTIDLTVDWYGSTSAYVKDNLYTIYRTELVGEREKKEIVDDGTTQILNFDFEVHETREELIVKENIIQVVIPQCMGENPISVTVNRGNSSYDPETRTLTINNETSSRINSYRLNVEYKKYAIDQLRNKDDGYSISANVTAKVVCHNNTNEEFVNPLVSEATGKSTIIISTAEKKGQYQPRYVFSMEMNTPIWSDERVLLKNNIYDAFNEENEPENIEYGVTWMVQKSSYNQVPTEILLTGYDDTIDGTSMGNYIRHKSITFTDWSWLIPSSAVVSIYDGTTNELISELTGAQIHAGDNTYYFDENQNVSKVNIKISNTSYYGHLNINCSKEIDVEKIAQNYTLEQVTNMLELQAKLTGKLMDNGSTSTGTRKARLIGSASNIAVSLSEETITSTETLENEQIRVSVGSGYVMNPWIDGIFLVEIPSNIVKVEVNNVSTTTNGVEILGYDVYKENGKNYIKVITNNDEEAYPYIIIDCNLIPDPRSASEVLSVQAYGFNNYMSSYWNSAADKYDIDGDEDKSERVAYANTNLSMVVSNTFITTETISNYNESNEITIAPNIAQITNETREATINVSILNNYTNNVENVVILGKVPFEGNTYVDGADLRSTFTAKMQDTGIEVSSYLTDIAKVYYTDVENPTNDIENESNGWKISTEWNSLESVKNYLIVINKKFNQKEGYTFTYKVTLPEGLPSNSAAYSCHKVWYDLNTSEGKLSLTAQPTKVGVRVVRPYIYELTKYKENTNLKISGAVFKVWEEVPQGEEDNARILITDVTGKITLDNVVVNQVYNVEEIKAPDNYMINEGAIQFKVIENQSGNLEFVQISNKEFKETPTFSENESGRAILQTSLEDKPKYKLDITKIEENGEGVAGIKFELNGKTYRTANGGKLQINNLVVGEEYSLKEVEAEGFFLLEDEIKFKVVEDENGKYVFESDSQYILEIPEIVSDETTSLIEVPITITNIKIPRFNLEIEKVEAENSNRKLANATFMLKNEDKQNATYHTTDTEGKINVNQLYQCVENANVTGKYTLKETQEPYGYMLNKEEIEFYVVENDNEELEINITDKENLTSLKDVEINNDTVKFIIEDKPLFSITKIDSETNLPLANAEFVIYELDAASGMRGDFAKDANGEYVGTLNDDGYYVLVSDENGTITAPLRDGKYKLVEIGFPVGYEDKATEEVFEVSGSRQASTISVPDLPDVSVDFERDNTFEISYIEDLLTISKNVNDGTNMYADTKVVLTRDLDFKDEGSYRNINDTSFGDINGDGTVEGVKAELDSEKGYGFPQIGRAYNSSDDDGALSDKAITIEGSYGNWLAFQGTFDGQGHELRNFYINISSSEYNQGLFKVMKNAYIKNLGITGKIECTIETGERVGSLVGFAENVYFENCYNKCTIGTEENRFEQSGGLVGYVSSTLYMDGCYNEGNMYVANYENGGLVGQTFGVSNLILNNCYNKGTINSTGQYTGGLIGLANGGNSATAYIYNSYNDADIIVQNRYDIGGLIGSLGLASIYTDNCYNKGNIYVESSGGIYYLGGLYGEINQKNVVIITNSFNNGNISASTGSDQSIQEIGGLVGNIYGNGLLLCSNLYNSGEVTAYGEYIGGVIGRATTTGGIMQNCYNTGAVHGCYRTGGVVGWLYYNTRNFSYTMQNCYNLGDIYTTCRYYYSAGERVGGIVGDFGGNAIVNCYNEGNIYVNDAYECMVGGIVGTYNPENSGSLTGCYNAGNINIEVGANKQSYYGFYVGGIGGNNSSIGITNSYNKGNISLVSTSSTPGLSMVIGGICEGSTVTNSYNTGNIDVDVINSDNTYISGITENTASYCYNTGNISFKSYNRKLPICWRNC